MPEKKYIQFSDFPLLRLYFHFKECPHAPVNLTAINITSRSVALKWSVGYNGNSPIIRHRIQYYQQIGNSEIASNKEYVVDGEREEAIVSNLQPVTKFIIRVLAENEIGSSDYGPAINITTLEEGMSRSFRQLYCRQGCAFIQYNHNTKLCSSHVLSF